MIPNRTRAATAPPSLPDEAHLRPPVTDPRPTLWLSRCCKASVVTGFMDGSSGEKYFVCARCRKACEAYTRRGKPLVLSR